MKKSNEYIEVVRSSSKGLSSISKESCDAITAVLARHFTNVGVALINTVSDLEALVGRRPDLVFLGVKFIPADPALGLADPNKIWLSDVFDEHEIAYTGSSQTAHKLERNKDLAKQRVRDVDLKTAAFCVIGQNQVLANNDVLLDFPLFVKPTNRGGGQGIDSGSVVHSFEQLQTKVQAIAAGLRSDVLIEEYLPGREFSVAILKDNHMDGYLAMPIELIAPADKNGSRLLSSQVKSSNTEQVVEVTDVALRSEVTTLALDVFYALGARDYGRIDIRLDAAGIPHFLEANLIPSLISGYGSFPKACVLNVGLEYESMIMRIAELGLAHNIDDSAAISEPLSLAGPALHSIEYV